MRRRPFHARPLAIVVVCFVMLVGDLTCYYKHPIRVGYSRLRNSRTQPSPSAVQNKKRILTTTEPTKKPVSEKNKSSIGVREKMYLRKTPWANDGKMISTSPNVLRMKNGQVNNNEILAELACEDYPIYHIRSRQTIVGRDQHTTHFRITSSNLVSRQHIEVII